MLSQLLNRKFMGTPFVSDWFPMQHPSNAKLKAVSMQLTWEDVTGTPNGNIVIQVSNDARAVSTLDNLFIEVPDNSSDSEMISLIPIFRYIRISYIPNSVSGGTLDVNMFYSSV